MTVLARILAAPVRAYRLIFSPWVGHNCRYQINENLIGHDILQKLLKETNIDKQKKN